MVDPEVVQCYFGAAGMRGGLTLDDWSSLTQPWPHAGTRTTCTHPGLPTEAVFQPKPQPLAERTFVASRSVGPLSVPFSVTLCVTRRVVN